MFQIIIDGKDNQFENDSPLIISIDEDGGGVYLHIAWTSAETEEDEEVEVWILQKNLRKIIKLLELCT